MILYAGGQAGITYITFFNFIFFIYLFIFLFFFYFFFNFFIIIFFYFFIYLFFFFFFLHGAFLRTLQKHAYSNILKSLQPIKGKISEKKI